MLKQFISVAALACAVAANAGQVNRLSVETTKGSTQFILKDAEIVKTGEQLIIKSSDAYTTYALSEVKGYSLVEAIPEFTGFDLQGAEFGMYYDQASATVFLSEIAKIDILAAGGAFVCSVTSDKVSLSQYPDGLYIIRANGRSIKVLKSNK